MKKLLTFLGVFFIITSTNATHIIGGYMQSEFLGNNQYLIHLTVYRDCYSGVPPFDNPVYISVYNDLGGLVSTVNVPPNDSSTVFVQGDCIPGNVCIKKANYYLSVTLPAQTGIYTVVYQRCCRSAAVMNITTPLNYGMTFFGTVNTQVQNSSVQYKHEFAAFTYVGDNFSFDASVTDSNGDSLVYSLTDALDGATTMEPLPMQPLGPPYASLAWQPPYSINNMLGGAMPLSIDPVSGLMTAVPGTIGVFCIPYKVEEYRNGILINTNRKEMIVAVNPASYFDVSGKSYADNGNQLLDQGDAWMIRLNLIDSILTAIDTNAISNGNYIFQSAINGVYLLKASASPTSIFYADHLPTYYGDVLYWHQAQEVEICTASASNVDINLIQGLNPGGPGFVGGLISQGANRLSSQSVQSSSEGITVILFNQFSEPVAFAVTDASGYFSIGNIPLDTYSVYVDKLNYLIDNSLAPQITLTSSNPSANNLAFTLHSTWLELIGFVGMEEQPVSNEIVSIYPNPATDKLYVRFNNNLVQGINYTIYNLLGEEVVSGKMKSDFIDTEKLSDQFYILKLETKNGFEFVRFAKM